MMMPLALRRQAREHALQDGDAADANARLVAAAHAARQAAGEHEAESRGIVTRAPIHSSCTAALRRCLALSSST